MYKIVKIQRKIVYIKCTYYLDLWKKMEMFNTFNVQNHENSMENCVY